MSSKLKKIYNYYIYKNYNSCNCFREKFINLQQGFVNPTQTTNERISHALTTNGQGGRIRIGLLGAVLTTNSLGRIEGQIGGSGKALKNRF
jgi:hypothetical protein